MKKWIVSILSALAIVVGIIAVTPQTANALTYEIADAVYVGNVGLDDGYYVLEGSTEAKKGTPPADADYAYFKDRVLYLKNFDITTYRENRVSAEKVVKCSIGMFQYVELYWDDSYLGSIINDFPLTIHLTGTNRIKDSLADYSIYACYEATVTFTGNGTLEMNRPMEVSAGTTVKSGTVRMTESGAADKIPMIKTENFKMEGGELNMRAAYRSGIECTNFIMSSGKLDLNVLGNIQYTGSGLLAAGGVSFNGGMAKIQADGDAVQCSSLSIQDGVENLKFISNAASEKDSNYMAVDTSYVTLATSLKTMVSHNADGSGGTALPNNYTGNLAGNDYIEVMKCWTINGTISGVTSSTKTSVALYKSGSSTPMATTTVTGNGKFTFEKVEAGTYTVKATAAGYITASKTFVITADTVAVHPSLAMKLTPKFTTQPKSGTVGYNERNIVNWATNFTPVKQELVRYSSAGSVVQTQALSAGAFQAGLSYMTGGYYYRIRAYYSTGSYIESDKIYVTPDQYFSPNPQYGNTEEDIIEGITYVPNDDGTFNAHVHVNLNCVDGQMLQYEWVGTGYCWYDHNNTPHYGSIGMDTDELTFTVNVCKNLKPGKEWRVKVYLADDYYADWEWQGYSFNYFTDTVPELKPEDVPVDTTIASGWSGDTQWTLTSDGVMTFTGTGNIKSYGYDKKQPWLAHADKITSVVINDGIKAVGSGAFMGLTKLESVTLPTTGLTKIGEAAFYGCTSLKEITIPEGIYTIWLYTFKGCTSLEKVKMPKTLIKVDQGAFENCTSLTYVYFPTNVEIIGSWSFKGCTGLTEVDMTWTNATKIREGAFKNCSALTTIHLPEKIQTLGDSCFYGIGATSFTVPETVTSIEAWCFARAKLTKITFKGNAPSIGDGAFNKITLTAWYNSAKTGWNSSIKQNYGGTVTWKAQ